MCVAQAGNIEPGDTVTIVNDEAAVRAMQSGHGGWNSSMKSVCTIVQNIN